MTHSREFYLLDDEQPVDECGAYPAYFPVEDRIGLVFYSWLTKRYYPSCLDETAGFYDQTWKDHPLTRLDP